jgi:hypothetical protein
MRISPVDIGGSRRCTAGREPSILRRAPPAQLPRRKGSRPARARQRGRAKGLKINATIGNSGETRNVIPGAAVEIAGVGALANEDRDRLEALMDAGRGAVRW